MTAGLNTRKLSLYRQYKDDIPGVIEVVEALIVIMIATLHLLTRRRHRQSMFPGLILRRIHGVVSMIGDVVGDFPCPKHFRSQQENVVTSTLLTPAPPLFVSSSVCRRSKLSAPGSTARETVRRL